jgi:hypothetical protein
MATLAVVPRAEIAQRAPKRSEPQWYADITKLEARLRAFQGNIIKSQYEVGCIIHKLHEMFPHGHWIAYRAQMCKRVGMSERSAHNYEQAYITIQAAGGDALVAAATMENLNLNNEFTRQVLAVAASEHPELPATKLATLAKIALHKNPAVDQLPALRRQFPSALIQRVGKGEMVDFEAWVDTPARKVRGSGLVMASLTYAQLRSVKGMVKVGQRGSFDKVQRFLKLNR